MNLSNYRKLVVAVVGISVMLVNQIWGVDLTGMEPDLVDAVNVMIGVVTAFGVERVANKPA